MSASTATNRSTSRRESPNSPSIMMATSSWTLSLSSPTRHDTRRGRGSQPSYNLHSLFPHFHTLKSVQYAQVKFGAAFVDLNGTNWQVSVPRERNSANGWNRGRGRWDPRNAEGHRIPSRKIFCELIHQFFCYIEIMYQPDILFKPKMNIAYRPRHLPTPERCRLHVKAKPVQHSSRGFEV